MLHLLIPIMQASYCFLFKKNKFDYVYLCISYFIILHWTFLNGECIISYYYKKNKDESYIAGKDCLKNDFHIEYKQYATYIYLLSFLMNIFIMYNIYAIVKRNHYPLWLAFTFIVIYEIYYYGIFFFKSHYKNKSYLFFQEFIKYSLLVWGLLFIIW